MMYGTFPLRTPWGQLRPITLRLCVCLLVLWSDANGLALALYIILSSDELNFVFTHHGNSYETKSEVQTNYNKILLTHWVSQPVRRLQSGQMACPSASKTPNGSGWRLYQQIQTFSTTSKLTSWGCICGITLIASVVGQFLFSASGGLTFRIPHSTIFEFILIQLVSITHSKVSILLYLLPMVTGT